MTIAKNLANLLNDKALHINEARKLGSTDDKTVGFVYPVHNYDMPNLMKDFVREFNLPKAEYTFGIFTHGGDKGNSALSLKQLLQEKGKDLNYFNDVLMPVNSRIMYGMTTDKIEERTAAAVEKLPSIAKDIQGRKENARHISKKVFNAMMQKLIEKDFAKRYFTPSINQEICIGCGVCAKVCPVQNITLTDGKAFIEKDCEQCQTCMHWCSQVAIHYGKRKVRKEQQYHHPEVRVKDIIQVSK